MNAPIVFSRSELKVAALLARGHINKDIARTFGVTEATIKAQVSSFMKKAGLERPTRVNAALAYLRLCDDVERDEIIGGPARARVDAAGLVVTA